jgi:hypothetical protein
MATIGFAALIVSVSAVVIAGLNLRVLQRIEALTRSHNLLRKKVGRLKCVIGEPKGQ